MSFHFICIDQTLIQNNPSGSESLSAQFVFGTATISKRNFGKHPENHFKISDSSVMQGC